MATEVSIAVLKRKDPDIVEVLAYSSHVCLYRMPMETQVWVLRDVEGPVFLVKRNTHPRFQLVVLNNKTQTGIFTEDVHGGLDFEVNPPYLMYTSGELEITGMWFYSLADLTTVSAMLQRIQASMPRPEEPEPLALTHTTAAAVDSSASDSNNDNDFWDKARPAAVNNKPTVQEPVQATQQQQPQQQQTRKQQGQTHRSEAPRQESAVSNNFADLLKHAQAKQQLQQQEANGLSNLFATAVAITSTPTATATQPTAQPTLLPPRFFETLTSNPSIQPPSSDREHVAQEQMVIPVRHHTNNNSRVAPTTSVPSVAASTQDTATSSAVPVNSLTRLFGKNAVSTTLQPLSAAAALTPTSKRTAHNNAAATSEHLPASQASSNNNEVSSQGASTTVPSKQQSHVINTEGLVTRAQIRQAMTQLLSNDVFVDMIGEALQGVGLLQRK